MTRGVEIPALSLLAGVLFGAPLTPAQAAGFAIIEQSASGQGHAFAGAAATATDASTIFFNPAGLTRLEDPQVLVAFHLLHTRAEFTDQGSKLAGGSALSGANDDGGDEPFVPNLYVSYPLGDNLVAGFGINAPFGLETRYRPDWVGRYHAIRSDLATINLNPSLGWQATEHLALGVGLDAQYIRATLSNAIDFGSLAGLPQQADAYSEMSGNDWSWGYNLGALLDVGENLRLGLAYRSKIRHTLSGTIGFTPPLIPAFAGPFSARPEFRDRPVTAAVTLPETVSLSAAWQASEALELLADVTWTRWSRFKTLTVVDQTGTPVSQTPENWKNVRRYALGLDYHYSDAWTLRAGVAYDEEPIPDAAHRTPRIPGNDRKWLSFGFGYAVNPDFVIDVGYTHLFVGDTPIRKTLDTSVPQLRHTLVGNFDNSVDILSAQFRMTF
ncbi:MAG: transporter [Gammaproteobacteria bacterium]|nr:MAG: transporter [Gammaproteobacteria bacterium]